MDRGGGGDGRAAATADALLPPDADDKEDEEREAAEVRLRFCVLLRWGDDNSRLSRSPGRY